MKILADENVHADIVRELRQAGCKVLFGPEIGLAGSDDEKVLEYSEKNKLVLLSGDKDFGGLIEFGALWGRGRVILLRYRLVNIKRIVTNIVEILDKQATLFKTEKTFIVVLSESGYRIHRLGSN